ncbi:MAG: MmcQ/YjbR family DNA-binding protein, partial [Bacteroidota bacterium]|nr:MmcQ/YjbR family DNA-binding protein [Bacteroidota bacterium]
MVDFETFRTMALSLPGAEEQPHFNLPSFRINKKIFATLWENENRAMLKLSLISQSVFCSFNTSIFFPV